MFLPVWTRWAFLGVLIGVLGVGVLGVLVLLKHIETLVLDRQIEAQAYQAARIAGLLERELAHGKTPSDVVAQLQERLATMPVTDASFLCLLNRHGEVISHPRADRIGQAPFLSRMPSLENQAPILLRRKLARGFRTTGWLYAQAHSGAAHLVYQKPVEGASWVVSVHHSTEEIQRTLNRLRRQVSLIAISFGFCVVLGSSILIHRINAAQERQFNTELQQINSQYRTLIEKASDSILVLQDGKRIYQNPARERLLGYSLEETSKHDLLDEIAPDDHERVQRYAARRLEGKAAPRTVYGAPGDSRRQTSAGGSASRPHYLPGPSGHPRGGARHFRTHAGRRTAAQPQ